MSSVEQPHKVLIQKRDAPDIDISRHVISIDKFTDVGSIGGLGEIASSQVMLNSDFGRFLTNTRIDQFTQFDMSVTSPYNPEETYRRMMILDEIMPQTEEGGGYITTVQLYGREWALTKVKMTGHYFFLSFIKMIEKILDVYNAKRGDSSPIIQKDDLELDRVPAYTAGIFDFGYETSCYKALLAVLARLRLPVSGGGAGEYYEMRFEDIDDTRLRCSIFPYGGRTKGSSIVTLNGKDIDTQYISETKQNIKGTVVVARGQADTGRYPKEIALWSNIIEEFNNAPVWVDDITYQIGDVVFWKDRAWRAREENSGIEPGTNDGFWGQGAAGEDYNPEGGGGLANFVYSPWTSGNAHHYANLASTEGDNLRAFPDSNMVIKDGLNYRNWADFRVTGINSIDSSFLLDNRLPQDIRVLVDSVKGTPRSPFTKNNGKDKFGNPYKDAIVQYRNEEWIVIHNPKLFDECTIITESKVYVYGVDIAALDDNVLAYKITVLKHRPNPEDIPASDLRWEDMKGSYLGYDCFHKATSISQDTENDHKNLRNANLVNTTVQGQKIPLKPSAIRVEYSFADLTPEEVKTDTLPMDVERYTLDNPHAGVAGMLKAVEGGLLALSSLEFFIKDTAYQYGWWATLFQAPFPRKSDQGNAGTIFKQSTLDLKNLNYTSGGNEGWGHEDSEDLGQITGITFLFKFQYTLEGLASNLPLIGNLPFRVTMYDTEDNVWTADFVYRFLGDTQQVILPISAFRIYRARNPAALNVDDLIQNILTPDLKILEIFETRKIKMITLQWQASYDSVGRYSPANANRYFINLGGTLVGRKPRFVGWFDAVGFIKAPIAQAKRKTDDIKRHIMPDIKDYPHVSSQSQLEKIANAERDLAEFRFDDYVLKTTGKCDLRSGDAVYVHDDDIIQETTVPDLTKPAQELVNTKRLSVRKINYTVNASDGPSGFVRHVTVQDRIGNPEVE